MSFNKVWKTKLWQNRTMNIAQKYREMSCPAKNRHGGTIKHIAK